MCYKQKKGQVSMAKNNIRSFRFSDEVAAIIERFEGASFNDKLERIILHCFWERGKIEEDIKTQRRRLADLQKRCDEARAELFEYESLLAQKKKIDQAVTQVVLQAIDYQEQLKNVTQSSPAAAEQLEESCVTERQAV